MKALPLISGSIVCAVAMVCLTVMGTPGSSAAAPPLGHEAQVVVDRLLAPPTINTEPGFTAKLLVAPGQFYDPLFMVIRHDRVWINDDGGATDGHGSRILAVTPDGKIAILMGIDKL